MWVRLSSLTGQTEMRGPYSSPVRLERLTYIGQGPTLLGVVRGESSRRFFALFAELVPQPGAGERPLPVGGGARQAQVMPRLLHRQAAERVELNEFGPLR